MTINLIIMSTVIYPSPIFGPVHSRRLGISLGINLMPSDGKVCTFDCVYCECGYNADHRPSLRRPSRQEVSEALETRLQLMDKEGRLPDVLTFAGNGEPTTHTDFKGIIEDTVKLRDTYCPKAKVSVLSNATLIERPEVFKALMMVDNNILKLDTVDARYIKLVNRPTGSYNLTKLIDKMKAFDGHCIIQTMFLHGTVGGIDVSNLGEEYVKPWLDMVNEIKPSQVMIYTIDRETPEQNLRKATHEELDNIVKRIERLGIHATASY